MNRTPMSFRFAPATTQQLAALQQIMGMERQMIVAIAIDRLYVSHFGQDDIPAQAASVRSLNETEVAE